MKKILYLFIFSIASAITLFYLLNPTSYRTSNGGWDEAEIYLAGPVIRDMYVKQVDDNIVDGYQNKISECLPSVDNAKYYSSNEIKECLILVFNKAGIKLETQALATGLSNLIIKHPLLGLPCHEPAHLVGEITLKAAGGDIKKALATHDHPSCEAGFIHGLIDAFAITKPSPLEFAKLVDACESSADTNMFHYCTHGIGHAAWILTEDGVKASKYCALLRTPEGRAQCGEGVMMDMFEPATTRFPSLDRKLAPTHLPDVCNNWERKDLPGMLQGCAHGASFVFSKKALAVVYDWSENKLTYPYPDILPKEMITALEKIGEEVKNYCLGLGGFQGLSCSNDLSIALPHVPHPLLLREDVRTALCSKLGKEILKNCVNQVRVNL